MKDRRGFGMREKLEGEYLGGRGGVTGYFVKIGKYGKRYSLMKVVFS